MSMMLFLWAYHSINGIVIDSPGWRNTLKRESSVSSSGGLMGETIMDFMQTYENIMIDVYKLN